mmetsp:Transcript_195/g.679  ORF Transcript_195/g.679 Transcript_195/m.679 type:complete len:220 (-) Transcript_195:454-1113(-)
MLDPRLDRDEHLGQPLVPVPVPLVRAARRLGRRHLRRLLARLGAVLEPLHALVRLAFLGRELVDVGLCLGSHLLQVPVRRLLREELLNHLAHVGHPRGLLDLAEGRLVRPNLLLLLCDVRLAHARPVAIGTAVALRGGEGLAPGLFAPLELGLRLGPLGHQRLSLRQLLVSPPPLLRHRLLKLGELLLGELFGVVRLVRHEEEVLVVGLPRLERALPRL